MQLILMKPCLSVRKSEQTTEVKCTYASNPFLLITFKNKIEVIKLSGRKKKQKISP